MSPERAVNTVVAGVDEAVAALQRGELVAAPTDTVYGLMVAADRPGAAAALARAKGRDAHVPVQVLVAGSDQVTVLAGADGLGPVAGRLAERYWPGALTLVVRRRPDLGLDLGGDGTTVGVRAPDHPVVVALCRAVGPLAATSANQHGEAPLTTAAAVAAAFDGRVAVVVDGGPGGAVASTVVDVTGVEPVLLRQGAVPWEELKVVAGG